MDWSKVFLKGLNGVTWYHLDISCLLLAARALSAGCCCWFGGWLGLLVRLTFHINDVFDRLSYNTVSLSLTTLRRMAVKVYMQL